MNKLIKNFTYSFASNMISFVITALITMIMPKVMGVESYGYFQLYLFYVNYIGFLHLGWADGIFLRYGGAYYDDLNKKKFSGQFWAFSIIETVIGIAVILLSINCVSVYQKEVVYIFLGISIIVHLPRTFLQYVLQSTNRIKEYSILITIEKVIFVACVVVLLVIKEYEFVWLVLADIIGKTAALIYGVYQCRDIVRIVPEKISCVFNEAGKNISVGIKLMFANIAGMLVVGIVRLAIERGWDVATFGKISLTMSVSSLLMILIRAVAMIMFPMLRRTEKDKLPKIYKVMRDSLMLALLGMLMFYYPVKVIISSWIPHYADSLNYMALLFPMCIFESKMSMLIETYMKTLRQEKALMIVNIISVITSFFMTWGTVYVLHDLNFAVISIVIVLAFRCVLAEIIVAKELKISVVRDIIFEVLMTAIFMTSSWCIGGIKGVVIYLAFYCVYIIIKRKELGQLVAFVKKVR